MPKNTVSILHNVLRESLKKIPKNIFVNAFGDSHVPLSGLLNKFNSALWTFDTDFSFSLWNSDLLRTVWTFKDAVCLSICHSAFELTDFADHFVTPVHKFLIFLIALVYPFGKHSEISIYQSEQTYKIEQIQSEYH